MADAGNYILMTVYMTLPLFPFTVDRPFLRDTTPARRAGPGYLSKSLLPMRIESVYTRMHIVYTSALLLCVVSLLATSLSSLYAFRRRVARASLARLCFIGS
jgi:hypothetical protein